MVQPDGQRGAARLDQFVQGPNDLCRWQAGVNLDAQAFSAELVDDVEGAELASRPQSIGHDVTAPALIGLMASHAA